MALGRPTSVSNTSKLANCRGWKIDESFIAIDKYMQFPGQLASTVFLSNLISKYFYRIGYILIDIICLFFLKKFTFKSSNS